MIGIFPSDEPQFIVYVVIQNPKGESYYGSTLAAPVFHDIAVGLIDQSGMSRAGARTVSPPQDRSRDLSPQQVEIGQVMPDLTGTPMKLLLPLLLRNDISVTIRGSGFVAKAGPSPRHADRERIEDRPGAAVSFRDRNLRILAAYHPQTNSVILEGSAQSHLPGASGGHLLGSSHRYTGRHFPAQPLRSSAGRGGPGGEGNRPWRQPPSSSSASASAMARRLHGPDFPDLPVLVIEPNAEVVSRGALRQGSFPASFGPTAFICTSAARRRLLPRSCSPFPWQNPAS